MDIRISKQANVPAKVDGVDRLFKVGYLYTPSTYDTIGICPPIVGIEYIIDEQNYNLLMKGITKELYEEIETYLYELND